ncbi:hypothetical protein DERF_010265 [Dermatophagoides farinae]|uniref:Uncharacterized protein n=1 Tax=Dermatophagoides farinae TaxID=6954 RepID=A0A922L6P4_DERFA|nr:hypothetical protein DERF_010265 [Dermatophagoides farinae]
MFGFSSNEFYFDQHNNYNDDDDDDDTHENYENGLIDRIIYRPEHLSKRFHQYQSSLSTSTTVDGDHILDNVKWLYKKRNPSQSIINNDDDYQTISNQQKEQKELEHHHHHHQHQHQHHNIHNHLNDIDHNVIFQSSENQQQQQQRHHSNIQNGLQQSTNQQQLSSSSSSSTLHNHHHHHSEIPTRNLNPIIDDNDLFTEREREYYKDYDPMVGYRIALSLGLLILIFIIFVLYKTHCQSKKNRRLLMNAQQNIQMSNLRTSTTTNDL